jgi:hypothetical protein
MASSLEWAFAVDQIEHDARTILKDDPCLLDCYDGFERVMWSDDKCLITYNFNREEMLDALRCAYRHLKEEMKCSE